jgi:hypothetical protein
MTWLDHVRKALANLDGVADIKDIYVEVSRLRGHRLDCEGRAGVRKLIYLSSSDSKAWLRQADLFFSVEGIRGEFGVYVNLARKIQKLAI